MAISTINQLPTAPARTQDPEVFSSNADAFLGALPAFGAQLNQASAELNAISTKFDNDKNAAAEAKTLALQYSQQASAASIASETSRMASQEIYQKTILAAEATIAVDLSRARKAVTRQNMTFFKLNLL